MLWIFVTRAMTECLVQNQFNHCRFTLVKTIIRVAFRTMWIFEVLFNVCADRVILDLKVFDIDMLRVMRPWFLINLNVSGNSTYISFYRQKVV